MSREAFEAFGVTRVSPSEIKQFHSDPGMWFAKKIAKIREDAGPAAWRGDAVEAGLNAYAYGAAQDPLATARVQFTHRLKEWEKSDACKERGGEYPPGMDEEEAKIPVVLERAMAAWDAEGLKALGKPSSAQQWCEVHLGSAPIPCGGKWDWGFPGFAIDLKTANTIPSISGAKLETDADGETSGEPGKAKPEIDHAIQVSIYAKARKETTAKLLYVSAKMYKTAPKSTTALHRLVTLDADDIERYSRIAEEAISHMGDLMTAALAMTEYMPITKERALARLCRPNFNATGGGFYSIWKDDFRAQALKAVPAWA